MPATSSKPSPVDARIYLAAERTLLAWIRTGLALMGFGLLVAKLRLFLDEMLALRGLPATDSATPSNQSGTLLLLLGVLVIVASSVRHFLYLRSLDRSGPDAPVRRHFPLLLAGVLALAGLLLAARIQATDRLLGRPAGHGQSEGGR